MKQNIPGFLITLCRILQSTMLKFYREFFVNISEQMLKSQLILHMSNTLKAHFYNAKLLQWPISN